MFLLPLPFTTFVSKAPKVQVLHKYWLKGIDERSAGRKDEPVELDGLQISSYLWVCKTPMKHVMQLKFQVSWWMGGWLLEQWEDLLKVKWSLNKNCPSKGQIPLSFLLHENKCAVSILLSYTGNSQPACAFTLHSIYTLPKSDSSEVASVYLLLLLLFVLLFQREKREKLINFLTFPLYVLACYLANEFTVEYKHFSGVICDICVINI